MVEAVMLWNELNDLSQWKRILAGRCSLVWLIWRLWRSKPRTVGQFTSGRTSSERLRRADSFRPGAEHWFDRQMSLLESFDITLTFCFTPEHRGILPNHTSPPLDPGEFAEFCARMTRRYS